MPTTVKPMKEVNQLVTLSALQTDVLTDDMHNYVLHVHSDFIEFYNPHKNKIVVEPAHFYRAAKLPYLAVQHVLLNTVYETRFYNCFMKHKVHDRIIIVEYADKVEHFTVK